MCICVDIVAADEQPVSSDWMQRRATNICVSLESVTRGQMHRGILCMYVRQRDNDV